MIPVFWILSLDLCEFLEEVWAPAVGSAMALGLVPLAISALELRRVSFHAVICFVHLPASCTCVMNGFIFCCYVIPTH
jgi:hypothetical protein